LRHLSGPGEPVRLLAVDEYERRRRMTESISVVPFQPDLAPVFARLHKDWIERLFAMEESVWKVLRNPDREVIRPGGQVFVALQGSKPAGTAAATLVSPGRFELAKMAVDPVFQGRGIGRLLGEAVVDFVRSRHADTLPLVTNSRLDGAIRLYERLGFEACPMPFQSEYGRVDAYMALVLAPRVQR
jgi:GNAT superfamily N-acetyltransferase